MFRFLKMIKVVLKDENRYPFVVVLLEMTSSTFWISLWTLRGSADWRKM